MYKTMFEFENKEDTNVLLSLLSSTLLEYTQKDNIVTIYEDLEEDAEYNLEYYYNILQKKEIYVFVEIENENENRNINYYREYGINEKDFI